MANHETIALTPTAPPAPVRRLAKVWISTVLALFLVLVGLGIVMRLNQSALITLNNDFIYSLMTLHGLGMSGTLLASGLVIVWYLLSAREVRPYTTLMWIAYGLSMAGTAGLIVATMIGRFAPGWYVLYPLPFVNPTWPAWASGLAFVSLIVLGVSWLLVQFSLLAAMARRYGFGHLLGWQYFQRNGTPQEIPPIVLITTISLLAGTIATLCGAVFLLLNLAQWGGLASGYDPLLMKNMVFLFGHTIVNITMYLGIAAVYEVLPRFSGRSWPSNKIVVLSWNLALIFVLFAYFHHLYMDFVQPESFQYLGQIASYASSVPATVVTVFGVIGQVLHSGLKWRFIPIAFFLGIVGWVVGGFAAVIDSTIGVNSIFHNTLWVPAHFHTYFLMGYVLIALAMAYGVFYRESENVARTSLVVMLLGGYGFLASFYVGGVFGIPRRYASYSAMQIDALSGLGSKLALLAVVSALVFLAGFVIYLISLALKPSAASD